MWPCYLPVGGDQQAWKWSHCNHPQKGHQQNCQVLILLKGVPLLWLEEFLIPPSDRKNYSWLQVIPTMTRLHTEWLWHTVDGRTPAPADMVIIMLFSWFYTSQVCPPSTVSSGMWWLLDFIRGRLPPSHLLHTSTSEVCSWDPKVLLEEKAANKNKTPLIRLLTTRQLKHLWYNYQQTTPFNGEATKNMKETMTSPELFRWHSMGNLLVH